MKSKWFDVEIVTTTKKKWNLSIIIMFPLLLILCLFSISAKFYLLILLWTIIAGLFLFYEYFHSNSLIELDTKLLFNDDCLSIVIEDNNFNLRLKKEDVTNVKFDKKKNKVTIYQNEKVLYEFTVNPKTLDELVDVFNSFGYKCETSSFI